MPLVALCAGIALVALFIWLFGGAADPPRADRFARAHAVDLRLQDRPAVTRYLARVRRLRTAGVLVALLGSVAVSFDRGFVVYFAALLLGWLAGAAGAELSTRPAAVDARPAGPDGTPAVPGWLRRFAWTLAAVATAATGGALAVRQVSVPQVLGWGVAGLAAAGAVALAIRAVLSRPVFGGVVTPRVERALRANAAGGVAATGIVATAACLGNQAYAVKDALLGWDPVPGAVEQATVACGVVTLLLARFVVTAARQALGDAPVTPVGTRPRVVAAVAVVALVASAAWVTAAWVRTRAPYPPAALHAVASIRLTSDTGFAADAAALGVTGLSALVAGARDRPFVGRIDFGVPPAAHDGGTYWLVVIDARANRMAAMLETRDGSGWDGYLGVKVPARYPWLSAIAPIPLGGGVTEDPGSGAWVSPEAGTVEFQGLLGEGSAVSSPTDLLVALIFTGPDDQIYWATRVPVATA